MTDPTPTDGRHPELDPAEEAEVRERLAALPDPELPADVAARLDATLRDLKTSGIPGAAQPATGTDTQVRHLLPAPRRHPGRLAAAAAVVLVLALGTIGVLVLGGDGSDDPPPTATGRYAVEEESAVVEPPITSSGYRYTEHTLGDRVELLLDPDRDDSSADHGDTRATFGFNSGPDGAPAVDAARAELTELVRDPVRRAACVAELTGEAGVQPLAVDVGTFRDRAAAVIVLPLAGAVDRVEVWVVGATCSPADDPFPLFFRDLPRN